MTSPDEPPVNPEESAVTDVPMSLLSELNEILRRDIEPRPKIIDESRDLSAEIIPPPTADDLVDDESSIIVIDDTRHETAPVAESEEQGRISIVDKDEPDARFEARIRGQKRRERIKKQRWIVAAGSGVGIAFVVIIILASPILKIQNVEFEGKIYTSDSKADQVTKILRSQTIFSVESGKVRQILSQDPWVDDVRVTTHFPRRVVVEISERQPVVWFLGVDNRARIIDASGHVISVTVGRPTKYLQVTGVGPSLLAGAVADDVYRATAQLYVALPDEIRSKARELGVSVSGEISLTLKSGTLVRFGPPTNLQNKLVAVVVLLRRQDPAALAVIDVSTGEPTVQPR